MSVALNTIFVSLSFRLVFLGAGVVNFPLITSLLLFIACAVFVGGLEYNPVPRETMVWIGDLTPQSSRASCSATAVGLLVSRAPS